MSQQGLFQMANSLSLADVMLSAVLLSPLTFVKDHKGMQSHHPPPPAGCLPFSHIPGRLQLQGSHMLADALWGRKGAHRARYWLDSASPGSHFETT